MPLVELDGLGKSFGGTPVLCGISAGIDEGEFVVVLGPSGCGKSTLLRMIAGLEETGTGTIHIDGRRVDGLPPKARGCAMVFQNYALYPHLTVRGNIGYGLRVAGLPRADRAARIAEVAKLLEIEPLLDRRPGQLSGGQRQRVAIARAIAREPRVFLFDEPLSNLDAKLRAAMRTELRKIHDRIGATSLFVTHDQVEAMTLADRIVVLNGGRIVQIGTPEDIYHRPADLFVAGFIGSPPMNVLPGRISDCGQRVETALGLAVPLAPGLAHPGPGISVSVGIRAEDIALGGESPATVEHVEDLGAHLLLHCRIKDQVLVVMGPARRRCCPGDPVGLRVDPAHLSIFDGSGRRL